MSLKPLYTGTIAPHTKIRIYGAKPQHDTHKLVSVMRPPDAIRVRNGASPQANPQAQTSDLQIIAFIELDNRADVTASYAILSLPKRAVDAGIPLGALDFLAGAANADISILEDP